MRLPLAGQNVESSLRRALSLREIEQPLEHRVDERPLMRRQRARLWQAVHRPIAEHERALLKILGTRGGEGRAATTALGSAGPRSGRAH